MADQGSIGVFVNLDVDLARRVDPQFGVATQSFALSQDKTISGTVTDGGSNVGGVIVYLHQRSSGMPLGRTISKSDGTFSFPLCRASSADHYVVAIDKDGGTAYNALIFDQVTPT